MSIALVRGGGGMNCHSMYHSPERRRVFRRFKVERRPGESSDSCSSSSIGRNSESSDGSLEADGSGETEVQSSYKGPLDTMDALEEVLPMRRSISKFYSGKSKSFTSLADAASSSSIKEIAKPENAYNRKRKNLLASSKLWDKKQNHPLRNNGGGLWKKSASSSHHLFAMSSSKSSNNNNEDSSSNSLSTPWCLPPRHPSIRKPSKTETSTQQPRENNFSPYRSFSLSDLQNMAPGITDMAINKEDKDDAQTTC